MICKTYHQIKQVELEGKNIEENEERQDIEKKVSQDRDAKNRFPII